jgi:hypothetical protein
MGFKLVQNSNIFLNLSSLQDLGFKEYIEEVYAAYEQHKLDTLVCTDLD